MPPLLYGTAWKKTDTARLVALAIARGFRGIDTACQPKHYNEAGVGEGVQAAFAQGLVRSDLYLQTKFTPLAGQDPRRVPYDPNASLAEQVSESLSVSLKNLQTDYVDGLVLHSPMPTRAQTATVWRAFEALVDGGWVRQLGVSNCYDLEDLEQLFASARIKPRILQNRFYAATGYDLDLRAYCARHRIVYQSFWTLTANPHILAAQPLADLAANHGRTAPQIFFRYLTQRGVVPLTGTKSESHMREDLSIFDLELTGAELASIDGLLAVGTGRPSAT